MTTVATPLVAVSVATVPSAKPIRFTPAAGRILSEQERATVRDVLSHKYETMHNKLFDAKNAQRAIFDEAESVPPADTSWYVPVMERLSDNMPLNLGATLLTAKQERALFLQYNYCRHRVCLIKKQIGERPVTLAVARDLLDWHHQAQTYRSQIADMNLALVLAMIKRMRMVDLDFSDLVSEGNMALLRAIDKFDVARGFKFSTYGCRAIIKALGRFGTKTTRYRRAFPVEFDPEFEKSDHLERKNAEVEDACVDELRRIIQENRAALTPVEQKVIAHRFALHPDRRVDQPGPSLTLNQVGELIGLTKERVRQIQNQAMDKIRQVLDQKILA